MFIGLLYNKGYHTGINNAVQYNKLLKEYIFIYIHFLPWNVGEFYIFYIKVFSKMFIMS